MMWRTLIVDTHARRRMHVAKKKVVHIFLFLFFDLFCAENRSAGFIFKFLCRELEFVFATAGVRVVGKISAGLSAGLLSRCTSAKTIIATATEREMKL
jgi:hypothetical protein